MSEVEEKAPSKKGGNNKLGICLLFISLCLALGSLFSSGGGSIGKDDALHYLGKSYEYILDNVGEPNNIVTSPEGQDWQYDGFQIYLESPGYVYGVGISSASLKAAGCSIADTLKSVESAMKKMDGGFVNQPLDGWYVYNFKHDGQSMN